MKKYFITLAILISSITFAQQEIKLNVFNALALKTVSVSYEHYINDQSSFGVSALLNFEKSSADFKYNEKRSITPYFRHYFTTENEWNIFGEGFFSINYGEKETTGVLGYEDYTDGALGVAVGLKYTTDKNFVLDVFGGIGRNLFSNDSHVIVPRIGVNVGWRF